MLLKCLALAIMILTGVLAMRGLPRTVRSVMKMSTVRTMEVAEFGKIVRDDDVRKVLVWLVSSPSPSLTAIPSHRCPGEGRACR